MMIFIIGLVISGIEHAGCIANQETTCSPSDQYVTITTPWDTYTDLDSSQFVQYHVRLAEDGGNLYFFT